MIFPKFAQLEGCPPTGGLDTDNSCGALGLYSGSFCHGSCSWHLRLLVFLKIQSITRSARKPGWCHGIFGCQIYNVACNVSSEILCLSSCRCDRPTPKELRRLLPTPNALCPIHLSCRYGFRSQVPMTLGWCSESVVD